MEGKDIKVESFDDLKNGLALIAVFEKINGTTAAKYHKGATLPVHCIDNLNVALKLISESGVNCGVTAEDIHGGVRKKLIILFGSILNKHGSS